MLEFVEKSLDTVPELVGLLIVRDLDFSVPLGRDDHFDLCFLDHFAQSIGVISLVSDHAARSLAIQQVGRGSAVVRFTAS